MLLPSPWYVWFAVLAIWLLFNMPTTSQEVKEEVVVHPAAVRETPHASCGLCFYALDDVMTSLDDLKAALPEMQAQVASSADVHGASTMLSDVYYKVVHSVARLHDVYACVEQC